MIYAGCKGVVGYWAGSITQRDYEVAVEGGRVKTNVLKCRTGGLGVEEDDEAVLSVWCMWMRESRLGLMCIV